MATISKAWVTLTDAATDADSPVDQALVQGIRDDLVHLREWLGASYTAGAVQDHNHDGQNSALVEIGPNAIRNGSFESDGDGWNIAAYTGGSFSFNTANDMDGAKALAITSTSTVNGGGKATSNEYRSCTGGYILGFRASVKASVANVSSRGRAVWYDDAQSQISTSDLFSYTNTPTAATKVDAAVTAPSNARFYKLELEGGVPGSGSATGTVYFDGVKGETGVLSLNGQTGQIVSTDLYAIGSYVTGRPANTTQYGVNSTLAGSSLYSTGPEANFNGTEWLGPGYGPGSTAGSVSAGYISLTNVGTWRCVSPAVGAGSTGSAGLWVRIS